MAKQFIAVRVGEDTHHKLTRLAGEIGGVAGRPVSRAEVMHWLVETALADLGCVKDQWLEEATP